MLSHLGLTNFGPIAQADFEFCSGVNVLVGENGTGKSLALRAAFLAHWRQKHDPHWVPRTAPADEPGFILGDEPFTEIVISELSIDHVKDVVRQRSTLSHLNYAHSEEKNTRMLLGRQEGILFHIDDGDTLHGFDASSCFLFPASDVLSQERGSLELLNKHRYKAQPSLLSLNRNLLIQSVKSDVLSKRILPLIQEVEEITGGPLPQITPQGHFRWNNRPIGLMAEGHRKLAAAAMLLANESIQAGDTLLWDEPEANLNPKLLAFLADWLANLAAAGVQVILSTHSLFLMRAFEIARKTKPGLPVRFFALHHGPDGVQGESADELTELQHLSSLDAELQQEDEYLALP